MLCKDPTKERFTIRVYGIWIKDGHILLSKEKINDFSYIQFPGGGVELGESILDALKREWIEETGIEIDKYLQFYMTDFFQANAFNPSEQLISVYYLVDCLDQPWLNEKDESTANESKKLELTWKPLAELQPEVLTFDDDKIICDMILDNLHFYTEGWKIRNSEPLKD